MTTITHATLIDRLEFASDCAAVRDRARQQLQERRAKRQAQLQLWMKRPLPKHIFITGTGGMSLPPARPPMAEAKPTKYLKPINEIIEQRQLQPRPGPKAKLISFHGKALTLKEWAAHLDINYNSLLSKVSRLGSAEAALTKVMLKEGLITGGYETTSIDSQRTGGVSIARDIAHSTTDENTGSVP